MIRRIAISLIASALPLAALAQSEGQIFISDTVSVNPNWEMPRTEHGHPDFQGTWFFGSRTPLQRRPNLGMKQTYTEQEARELEANMQARLDSQFADLDPDRSAPEAGARIGQEADDSFLAHFQEPVLVKVNGEYRTSVIIDPPDGRIPKREGFKDFTAKRRAAGLGDSDGPEGQPLSGRCLMFGAAVPSLTPIMMNPNLLIVQNQDYIMVMTEMINDARIIRLNDQHFDNGTRNWMGDSVGHWEGDTLVVHSKNFRPEQSSARSITMSEDFEVVERYRLVSDDEILYSFTVNDDQAYTQPFTGERILSRNPTEERIYEFACHEGNYSLSGILAGARRQEVEGRE
ncbi:MAG: hypothetical protein KJN90_13690 [Gammaproteobacteria bacterium]|nr:hypothetical protein [Gammaproteobacteria bacterium]